MHQASDLADRLNNTGFVVGQHHGNQRPPRFRPGLREPPRQRGEVDQSGGGDGHCLDRPRREPAAGKDGGMLDRRHQQAVAAIIARPVPQAGRERQQVGLRRARREHHIAGVGSDQGGNLLARLLDEVARGPALGVHRRWVADRIERSEHGRARLAAQRRGRVPVQIDPSVHHFSLAHRALFYPIIAGTPNPSKCLLFAPRAMLEDARRDRPALPAAPSHAGPRAAKIRMVIGTYVSLPRSSSAR